MGEMNFGRQLKPVTIAIHGSDIDDRLHWKNMICRWLQNQPCILMQGYNDKEKVDTVTIYPQANND